jgi:hypothetical protein
MIMDQSGMPLMMPPNFAPYSQGQSQHSGSIVLLTNPENDLYKLELTLRSMVLDAENNPKKAGEPLLNDEGVCSILGSVQSCVSQVSIMSNLEDDHISTLILFLSDTLAKDLMQNRKRYGIKNPAARDKIFHVATTRAFIGLRRSFEEGDRRFWKGSQQESIMTVKNDGQKKGLLGFLGSWKK